MIDAYAAFEYLITVNRIIIYRIKNLIFLAISVRWFIDNFSYIKRSTQSLARGFGGLVCSRSYETTLSKVIQAGWNLLQKFSDYA